MPMVDVDVLVATLALIGGVIMTSALLSGVVERSGLPHVAVFLLLGAVLGPAGLHLLDIGLDAPTLRIVATLSLTLVLFTDAVSLDIGEVRRHSQLAALVLGPGTLLSAVLIAVAGRYILGLAPAAATLLGAALASTDPVLLRGLLRRRDMPAAAKQALRLESGLNDIVLLPIVLVAMAVLSGDRPEGLLEWAHLGINLFVLGPGAGVVVGLIAVSTLDLVRRRIGVRRDYEALYSLGIAFAAFAAAEAVHASGFLAAFAAGLTITALDVELCDCFLEYGETTAEMALLFTFVLFGASLIWSGLTIITLTSLLFAVLALAVRPVVLVAALARLQLSRRARWITVWFGPRGLSSLLLILLPIFAGVPGSEALFPLCALVVLLSVVIHGASSMLVVQRRLLTQAGGAQRPSAASPGPEVRPEASRSGAGASTAMPAASSVSPATAPEADDTGADEDDDRISVAQLRNLLEAGAAVVILDVRTERAFNGSALQPQGAVRLPPDHVVERATELGLARDAWLVALCA